MDEKVKLQRAQSLPQPPRHTDLDDLQRERSIQIAERDVELKLAQSPSLPWMDFLPDDVHDAAMDLAKVICYKREYNPQIKTLFYFVLKSLKTARGKIFGANDKLAEIPLEFTAQGMHHRIYVQDIEIASIMQMTHAHAVFLLDVLVRDGLLVRTELPKSRSTSTSPPQLARQASAPARHQQQPAARKLTNVSLLHMNYDHMILKVGDSITAVLQKFDQAGDKFYRHKARPAKGTARQRAQERSLAGELTTLSLQSPQPTRSIDLDVRYFCNNVGKCAKAGSLITLIEALSLQSGAAKQSGAFTCSQCSSELRSSVDERLQVEETETKQEKLRKMTQLSADLRHWNEHVLNPMSERLQVLKEMLGEGIVQAKKQKEKYERHRRQKDTEGEALPPPSLRRDPENPTHYPIPIHGVKRPRTPEPEEEEYDDEEEEDAPAPAVPGDEDEGFTFE